MAFSRCNAQRPTTDNAFGIISDYGIIINGADNFPALYLVNDDAYLSGKPLIDGSIQAAETVK